MKKTQSILIAGLVLGMGLTSCSGDGIRRTPGKTYAPDMTYSVAYDAYTSNPNFEDKLTSRPPVPGTVARGHELPDHLVEGDTNAYKALTTHLRFTEAQLNEGKRLYDIYCGICHGEGLDGQGPLFTSGKFAAMPANLKDAKYLHMPVGTMYAAIKFGKNMMGSYASQLNIYERWQVIAYIKKVQSENGGDPFIFGAEPESASVENQALASLPSAEDSGKGESKESAH